MKQYVSYTSSDLKKVLSQHNSVAIMATGSIEQHGNHLPLSVDVDIAQKMCEEICKRHNHVLCLPPIYYASRSLPQSGGVNKHDTSIFISGETLIKYFEDIFISLDQAGLSNLIVLNGHYENESFLCEAAESTAMHTKMSITVLSWWSLIDNDFIEEHCKDFFNGWDREHAGVCETSLMMYLFPEKVKFINEDYDVNEITGIYNNRLINDKDRLNNGVLSSAAGSNKELGKSLFDEVINRVNSDILSEGVLL